MWEFLRPSSKNILEAHKKAHIHCYGFIQIEDLGFLSSTSPSTLSLTTPAGGASLSLQRRRRGEETMRSRRGQGWDASGSMGAACDKVTTAWGCRRRWLPRHRCRWRLGRCRRWSPWMGGWGGAWAESRGPLVTCSRDVVAAHGWAQRAHPWVFFFIVICYPINWDRHKPPRLIVYLMWPCVEDGSEKYLR